MADEPRRDGPQLITAAELPYDQQVARRRKRYLLMMSMRVPLLIGAAFCYHTLWLAILLLFISVPLPWVAVLIANDRPPQKRRLVVAGTINHERALPAGPREIVDSE